MKYIVIAILASFMMSSCGIIQINKKSDSYSKKKSGTTKSTTYVKANQENYPTTDYTSSSKYSDVVQSAKAYIGTPYRSGGTTSSGMDCSGLVITSFAKHGVNLPRVSRDQAQAGQNISLHEAQAGDLIFFNTSGNGISHVGIVEKVQNGELFFIHSSSSKGVIISSLENSYWKPRFVKVIRLN